MSAFPELKRFRPSAEDELLRGRLGAWFIFVAPKGTPAIAVKHVHDSAKTVMEVRSS